MTYVEWCWKKALESLGIQEEPIGSNWSKYIRVYLAFVSLFGPAPWCCAFVLYKLYQAAQLAGVKVGFPKTGSCSQFAAWARKNGRLMTTPDKTICLFLVRARDGNGNYIPGSYQHIGFFSPDGNKTCEGNSNEDGSAEGYEVVERVREPSDRYHYIRIA